MAAKMYFLCFAVTIFMVNLSKAQLIPGFMPPLYNAPILLNQGLNTFQQTQRLASLGVPQRLGNVGGTVGLPLLPKMFPAGIPVTRPLPPSPLGTGAKLNPLPAATLLLNRNPLAPRLTPLHIRSTDDQANTVQEKSVTSINPIDEHADDDFKEVIGSSGTFSNTNATDDSRPTKPRSADNIESSAELDYLSKAANPIDELESKFGSMAKKVGQGFKHAVEKINSWSKHSETNTNGSEKGEDYIPYNAWGKNSDSSNKNSESKSMSVSGIMDGYRKVMNTGQHFQNSQHQLPENLASGLRNAMDEFQQSMSKSSLMQNEKSAFQKNTGNPNTGNYNRGYENDLSKYSLNKEEYPKGKMFDSASKFVDNVSDSVKNFENSRNDQPRFDDRRFWEKASDLAGRIADSAAGSGKMENEQSEFNQRNNPMNQFWNSASKFTNNAADAVTNPVKSINEYFENTSNKAAGSVINQEKFGSNQYLGSGNGGGHYTGYHQGFSQNAGNGNSGIGTAATDMADKIVNAGKQYFGSAKGGEHYTGYHQGYSHNAGMENSGIGNTGIGNTATGMAGKIESAGNQYHGSANRDGHFTEYHQGFPQNAGIGNSAIGNAATDMAGKTASAGISSGFYPGNVQVFNPYAPSYGGGYYQGNYNSPPGAIFNPAINLGHGIGEFANGGGYYSKSNSENLPSGAALQYAMMNPMMVRSYRQIPSTYGRMGQAGEIVSAALGMAQGIMSGQYGQIANSGVNMGAQISGAANGPGRNIPHHFKRSSPTENLLNSAAGLAGSITNIAKNPGDVENDRILAVWNAAGDIGKSALNLGDLRSSRILGSINPLGVILNPTDMAGKIIHTAVNPGLGGNEEILQTYGPTYAGGYFPRNTPVEAILNSATQLVGGALINAALNPPGRRFFQSPDGFYPRMIPLGTIVNSAASVINDLPNIDVSPKK